MNFLYTVALIYVTHKDWYLTIKISLIDSKLKDISDVTTIYKTYLCGLVKIDYFNTTNILKILAKKQFDNIINRYEYNASVINYNSKHMCHDYGNTIIYMYTNKKDLERFLQSFLVLIRSKQTHQCILSKSLQLQWKDCAKETLEFLELVKTQWTNSHN